MLTCDQNYTPVLQSGVHKILAGKAFIEGRNAGQEFTCWDCGSVERTEMAAGASSLMASRQGEDCSRLLPVEEERAAQDSFSGGEVATDTGRPAAFPSRLLLHGSCKWAAGPVDCFSWCQEPGLARAREVLRNQSTLMCTGDEDTQDEQQLLKQW